MLKGTHDCARDRATGRGGEPPHPIIEDDRDLADALAEILDSHHYEVTTAYAAAQASELAESFGPDVALVDIRLGRASGTQLVAELKQRYPELVCVMITAYAELDSLIDALRSGADDYLRKPINPGDLFATLERVFAKLRLVREKQAAELALRRSEQQMRLVTDALPALIVYFDSDLRYRFVNRACARWYSRPYADIIGKHVSDIFLPAELDKFLPVLKRALAGESVVFETTISYPDGVTRDVESTSVPQVGELERVEGVFVLAHDISERKRAERALRDNEELFRNVLDNSPSAISLKDLQGHFRLVNQRFEDWYGHSAQDALDKTSRDLFPRQFAEAYEAQDREVLDSSGVIEREHRIGFADGSIRPMLVTKFPVRDSAGKIVGIGTINTDIAERKRIEEQLHQATKMQAVGQLAGGIAHDFNNMLMPIVGLTMLTMEDLPTGSRDRGNLEKVLQAANRAGELVKQILMYSRASDAERRAIKPDEVAKEALQLLRATLPSTIAMRQRIQADCGEILADPTQFHQVMINLCTNAAQAMGARGGELHVELKRTEVKRRITALPDSINPGSYIRLTVRDSGTGIDDATRERIFEPFLTTKDIGEGTGMGLAVVHGIVTSHGAAITVASRPGEGTSIAIYFALADNQPREESLDTSRALRAVAPGVLDDSPPVSPGGARAKTGS